MSQTADPSDRDFLDVIFGPATNAQTYLNLLYLLLAFPLGLAYFIFLTVGLSLGTGLLVLFVGVPILVAVLAACWGLSTFERQMARSMLGVTIPPAAGLPPSSGFWQRAKALFAATTTWKSFTYLMIKFPFGIVSFVLLVTGFSLSVSLILAPLVYRTVPIDFYLWRVDTRDEATVWCLIGMVLLILSMHMVNGLAILWGRFAKIMLGPE